MFQPRYKSLYENLQKDFEELQIKYNKNREKFNRFFESSSPLEFFESLTKLKIGQPFYVLEKIPIFYKNTENSFTVGNNWMIIEHFLNDIKVKSNNILSLECIRIENITVISTNGEPNKNIQKKKDIILNFESVKEDLFLNKEDAEKEETKRNNEFNNLRKEKSSIKEDKKREDRKFSERECEENGGHFWSYWNHSDIIDKKTFKVTDRTLLYTEPGHEIRHRGCPLCGKHQTLEPQTWKDVPDIDELLKKEK